MLMPAQIRAARGLLGWRQDDLALNAAVSRRTVVSAETEGAYVSSESRQRIAEALEGAGVRFEMDSVRIGVSIPRPELGT